MNWLREWDWALSVERHRRPLCWIVMTLFAMAGLVAGAVIETLPRHTHRTILHTLRPTEAAVRRLIVLVMRAMDEAVPTAWKRPEPRRRTSGRGRGKEDQGKDRSVWDCIPAFRLFDPRKYVGPPRRRTTPGYGPRIWNIDGPNDPAFVKKTPMPDDPVPAERICLRLLALKAALDDLPAQAVRLRRMMARVRRKWPVPMRRGRPPGYRARGKTVIDEILEDCQTQAIWALTPVRPLKPG